MELDLNKFKMGYFIVWKNEGGFIGDSIEKAQLSQGFSPEDAVYVHIDVSGGGQWAVRVNPPLTKVVDIRKIYKERHFKVVRYRNELYENSKRYKVAFWAASNCNLKYDFFGVLRFVIPFLWQIRKKFFCSENALWALQKDFPAVLNFLPPEECMPADFLDKYYFEVVYESQVPENVEVVKEVAKESQVNFANA